MGTLMLPVDTILKQLLGADVLPTNSLLVVEVVLGWAPDQNQERDQNGYQTRSQLQLGFGLHLNPSAVLVGVVVAAIRTPHASSVAWLLAS
jgi:hypothetical protein